MLIILKSDCRPQDKRQLEEFLKEADLRVADLDNTEEPCIGAVGGKGVDPLRVQMFACVSRVVQLSKPYKLASREMHPENSVVRIGDVAVGGDKVVVIAGPCAVESEEQIMSSAQIVKASGAVILRGGAFKPRTSPYAFQGLEEQGLKLLAKAREATGLPFITEITSPEYMELMAQYCDAVQVGARNMQNFELLKRVGQHKLPVMLKRGMSAKIEDLLMAAEYILSQGNPNVILCERGIRTFESATRNTLDISAVPVLKELTHLPVIVDPSHAIGIRDKVMPMARSAIACGADGVMIEVHPEPDKALSDGPQSLYPEQFEKLMREIQAICPIIGRQLDMNLTISRMSDRAPDARQVAFQGVPGAFSGRAVRQFFGEEVQPLPCEMFDDVFDQIESGEVLFGVVPLENSNGGSVHEVYDLLLRHEQIKIRGELRLRINQTLIGHPGASLGQIRRVYSHPQALAQCHRYLRAHPDWERLPTLDTAGAVKFVKDRGKPEEAALASFESAKIYDMSVLAESIEDEPSNYTRFAVIGRGADQPEQPDKVSLVYATQDRPGALLSTLQDFAEYKVNLSKLESRPVLGNPLEHMFYVDLELDPQSRDFAELMEQLGNKTVLLRDLGHYRKASHRIDG
ncbi:MAG: 3-deoxy-7-phosphoheptulonate synthase [Candidatus Alcyoniella australis]|nr:3-deoxy-7-phosphoheptulonate synthase [Candidatus Alcyoniella australis]